MSSGGGKLYAKGNANPEMITLPSGRTLAEAMKAVESQVSGAPTTAATATLTNTGIITVTSMQSNLTQPIKPSIIMHTPAVVTHQVLTTVPVTAPPSSVTTNKVLCKRRLQELVREVDPNEFLEEDVEEMLLQIADDFIDGVINASCQLAKHRSSNTLEPKDVQAHLEQHWNMSIPGFGTEELRTNRKIPSKMASEAHRQRMALIEKTMKKY